MGGNGGPGWGEGPAPGGLGLLRACAREGPPRRVLGGPWGIGWFGGLWGLDGPGGAGASLVLVFRMC